MAQPMPPLQSLIKPEQVSKLANFPEEQKAKYFQGITKLWEQINSRPHDSAEYQAAYKKLVEVSFSIKRTMDSRKEQAQQAAAAAAAAAGQNGARPPNAQPGQDQRPASQAGLTQQSQEQISQRVLERVEKLTIIVPPQYLAQNNPEGIQNFIKSMKQKYTQALSRYEHTKAQLERMDAMSQQRISASKPMTPQEEQHMQAQREKLSSAREQSMEWLKQFAQQQETWKAQSEQIPKGGGDTAANEKQEAVSQASTVGQSKEGQVQANNAGSTQDAARKEANIAGRPTAMSPPGQAPQQHQPMHPPSNSHIPVPPNNQTHPATIKVEPQAQEHKFNPPSVPPIHPPHHAEPQPLKHEDALEKARTYSQPGYPQNAPQSATHGHPPQHNQREGQPNSHSKMPVPKELNIPPPQPVSMSQSRPTLPNGPQMMGPLGQPAIQRTPGYVLEGDGERVLSKKKLEELVRQVTGGSGAEGEEGETISADVEEVSYHQSPFTPLLWVPPIAKVIFC